ncbi:metalloendopeptidase [Coemansia sp. RSA 552]|nr:metalloendopeptidase [Coemansia sp. RSA 552]
MAAVVQTRGFWYATAGAGTVGIVYYRAHIEESPTGRRRFINVGEAEEKQVGLLAYQQTMAEYGRQVISPSSPTHAYVSRVAQRIIQAAGLASAGAWEVHVINSPEKNAFVLPGGQIFVFSGLLPLAETEDGLATVLAHEIAHQYARHSAEKLSQARLLSLVYILAALFVDPTVVQIGGSMASLLLELPNSRQCEQEADEIGLSFMARACYDPARAVDFWQRMRSAEKIAPPQLLSTHPSTASRIEDIRSRIPDAELMREAANCPSRDLTRDFFALLDR